MNFVIAAMTLGFFLTFRYVRKRLMPSEITSTHLVAGLLVTPCIMVALPYFVFRYIWYWGGFHMLQIWFGFITLSLYAFTVTASAMRHRPATLMLGSIAIAHIDRTTKILNEVREQTNDQLAGKLQP